MANNYDVVINDLNLMAAFLNNASDQGRFPQGILSRYRRGGDIYIALGTFLRQQNGRGAVYLACDSHGKIYGVTLITVRTSCRAVKSGTSPAEVFIGDNGGLDQVHLRVWSRKSTGGLYRRAKSKYRFGKYAPSDSYLSYMERLAAETAREAAETAEDAREFAESSSIYEELSGEASGPAVGMVGF